jgi:exopolysaccharide biosynthesis polyprenyl glycosylphosphotransferase
MIRRHITVLRLALMASDAVSAVLLGALVAVFRFELLDPDARWSVSVSPLEFAIGYACLWVGALWLLGLYRLRTRWSIRGEIEDVLRATAVTALTSFSLLYLLGLQNVSRLFVVILLLLQPALTVASRLGLRLFLSWIRSRGYNTRQVLIVGAGPRAQAFALDLEQHTALGLRVMGHLAGPSDPTGETAHPVLGDLEQVQDVLHNRVVDEVVVCLAPEDLSFVEPLVGICEEEGKIVRVATDPLGGAVRGGRREQFGATQLITFVTGPDRALGLVIKRATDIVLSALGLVLLSPVLLGIAVSIWWRDGRPILFRQDRVGLNGRRFSCLKYRTMVPDAEERFPEIAHLSEMRGPAFKMTDDPRITRSGHWLRTTGLDELPQLVNVLRGEMSLVGPRPALLREVDGYTVWHRRRLVMRPGITGLWQVEGRRDNDFDRRVDLDLRYIDRWSIFMDVKIILRTIPVLFQQQGR